jgi:uncharacterized protein (DUF305 family)
MSKPLWRRAIAGAALGLLSSIAWHAAAAQSAPQIRTDAAAIARARADSVRRPYTAADVAFLTGMIHHHAQAILMAGWCTSHGAGDQLRTLCSRIINAQQDEILRMQQWLADRRQPIPVPDTIRATAMGSMKMDSSDMAGMAGMHHDPAMPAMMPGMLTAEQLHALDQANGRAFERLFLSDMIQHHQGAVAMVKQLFGTYGAGQDETIFKLATDINVDQSTEIARMQQMLLAVTFGKPHD